MQTIHFPTKLFIGAESLHRLKELKQERIFIVTDPFMVTSKKIEPILALVQEQNELCVFSDIVPDPPIENIMTGIEALTDFQPTILCAVGGGSPIDAAKGMKYFTQKIYQTEKLLFLAIPTTSGTGSEVTNFSVITNSEKGRKYPLVTADIQPDEAILAPELVLTVPPTVTADTGMDVLTHALEAYVSLRATEFSDALCEKVVALVFTYLPRCFKKGADQQAREKMHHASCLAGMAFNLTSLGLNHGIAHAAGAKLHIAHGRLNTILLTEIIQYNVGCRQDDVYNEQVAAKYAHLAVLIGHEKATARMGVRQLVKSIQRLKKTLRMPDSFHACGVDKKLFEASVASIAADSLKDGCTATNPRVPEKNEIEEILRKLY